MTTRTPTVIRKGARIRVATAAAEALAYVDLRFDDGHVERWIGPGEIRGGGAAADLVAWGEEVVETQGDALLEELRESFGPHFVAGLAGVPVEVVLEWDTDVRPAAGDRPAWP
jgi:hypothetical protein